MLCRAYSSLLFSDTQSAEWIFFNSEAPDDVSFHGNDGHLWNIMAGDMWAVPTLPEERILNQLIWQP